MSEAKKKKLRKRNIFIVLMLAVPLARFILGQFLNANMIIMAFNDYTMGATHPEFVGLENFAGVLRLFDTSKIQHEWTAVGNSFSIFFLTLFVNAPISLAFAYLLYIKVPGHKWMRVVLYFPIILSAVVEVLVFKSFFTSGPMDIIYSKLGIFDKLPSEGWLGPNTAWNTILIFSVWSGISGNLVYFLAFMTRIPTELVEAAKIDGASQPRVFFSIVLPIVSSSVTTIVSLSVAGIFSWAMPSFLFMDSSYGVNNTGTLGLSIMNYTVAKNYGIGAAYGVLLSLIATPITLGCRALGKKISVEVEY